MLPCIAKEKDNTRISWGRLALSYETSEYITSQVENPALILYKDSFMEHLKEVKKKKKRRRESKPGKEWLNQALYHPVVTHWLCSELKCQASDLHSFAYTSP